MPDPLLYDGWKVFPGGIRHIYSLVDQMVVGSVTSNVFINKFDLLKPAPYAGFRTMLAAVAEDNRPLFKHVNSRGVVFYRPYDPDNTLHRLSGNPEFMKLVNSSQLIGLIRAIRENPRLWIIECWGWPTEWWGQRFSFLIFVKEEDRKRRELKTAS